MGMRTTWVFREDSRAGRGRDARTADLLGVSAGGPDHAALCRCKLGRPAAHCGEGWEAGLRGWAGGLVMGRQREGEEEEADRQDSGTPVQV